MIKKVDLPKPGVNHDKEDILTRSRDNHDQEGPGVNQDQEGILTWSRV